MPLPFRSTPIAKPEYPFPGATALKPVVPIDGWLEEPGSSSWEQQGAATLNEAEKYERTPVFSGKPLSGYCPD
ncbi:MAG: hypothetical protein WB341_06245 [Terracidiphilus sp.]